MVQPTCISYGGDLHTSPHYYINGGTAVELLSRPPDSFSAGVVWKSVRRGQLSGKHL